MPTKKHRIKLAVTSEKEIMSLLDILNEIEQLSGELNMYQLEEIDLSEFEILKDFRKDDIEEFLEDLVSHLSGIHFHCILLNCLTMLQNCADPDCDTLEFHPDIKKGLDLLEEQEKKEKEAKENEDLYFIRTEGYSGNALIWWRPNSQGYTSDIKKAGRYSKEETESICRGSRTELGYRCDKILNLGEGLFSTVHADYLQPKHADIDFREKPATSTQ